MNHETVTQSTERADRWFMMPWPMCATECPCALKPEDCQRICEHKFEEVSK